MILVHRISVLVCHPKLLVPFDNAHIAEILLVTSAVCSLRTTTGGIILLHTRMVSNAAVI